MRWAREGTPSLRTTSSSRGSSITATSDPPAKSTFPRHDVKVSSDQVGAQRTEVLGRGHRAQ